MFKPETNQNIKNKNKIRIKKATKLINSDDISRNIKREERRQEREMEKE